jgi:hypothetical protein
MCEENTIVNFKFYNKFADEYFKIINRIDDIIFEDNIYISNYGELYNKTQDRIFDYENSSIYLKIKNSAIRGFSRWYLTTRCFDISNTDYETKRREKKLSYGYNVQNKVKYSNKRQNKNKYNVKVDVNNSNENNKDTENVEDKEDAKDKEDDEKEDKENEEEENEEEDKEAYNLSIKNSNMSKLELELIKYKSIYNELVKQKKSLEIKIEKTELLIRAEKETNKYQNTIIYIIRPKHNNFYMYIGHTINKDSRLKSHIKSTRTSNTKLYKTIRETGGWEHWEMVILDTQNCMNKTYALKLEQEWCEKLRPNLNSISPFA